MPSDGASRGAVGDSPARTPGRARGVRIRVVTGTVRARLSPIAESAGVSGSPRAIMIRSAAHHAEARERRRRPPSSTRLHQCSSCRRLCSPGAGRADPARRLRCRSRGTSSVAGPMRSAFYHAQRHPAALSVAARSLAFVGCRAGFLPMRSRSAELRVHIVRGADAPPQPRSVIASRPAPAVFIEFASTRQHRAPASGGAASCARHGSAVGRTLPAMSSRLRSAQTQLGIGAAEFASCAAARSPE